MGFRSLCWLMLGLLLGPTRAAERPLRVVTTFLPGYCFAANVGGDAAKVENLLPGNVSLHDYQLSPGDIRKLTSADLIVINGLGMETFLDKVAATAGKDVERKIVRLSEGLGPELIAEKVQAHAHEPGHDHGHNPHIWLDPKLATRSVTNVMRAFIALDPKRRTVYERNAAEYTRRLAALDNELERMLQPVREVPFITYHNAFPYFVRRYGLKQAGVVEQAPEVPPSPREMSKLHATIRDQKVKALFTEPTAATRLAKQIAEDARIQLAELDPLETGQLAPDSYEKGLRRNGKTLVETLGR
jgi:zinc transport system substrate-binding protein